MGRTTGGHPFHIVDVFGEEKYAGNQLAVVRPRGKLSDSVMQKIAREFNFPETTFIASTRPRKGGYDVRIFTPFKEVPFAGHPTLGTAFVIRSLLASPKPEEIVLNLKAGPIPVRFEKGKSGLLWMRQNAPAFGAIHDPEPFAHVLGLAAKDFDPDYPIQEVSTGFTWLIIPLKNLAAVKKARTDLAAYESYFSRTAMRSAGTSQPAGKGAMPGRFESLPLFLFSRETYSPKAGINARAFAHAFGVPEDPATGSANGCLAGYMVRHGYAGPGGTESGRTQSRRIQVKVEQGYEIGRPSLLHLDARESGGSIEVNVGGKVFPVAEGILN